MNPDTSTKVTITEFGDLTCPFCGSEYMHQGGITVYDRGEDAHTTRETVVTPTVLAVVGVKSEDSANPSPRRHGLTIRFNCEGCRVEPQLNIYQHKGHTMVEWDYTSLVTGIARDKMLPEGNDA